jgi:predicted Zn-dependent protease
VFDATLRQGLAIQLEQSPFLSLVSDRRIQGALRLMGKPVDARLTPELAREVCERTGGAAVLDGSIAGIGSQFVLGLRARSCSTGDVLDEEQVQAARKEDVLTALSQIAVKFRTRIGESLATIQKHSTPLPEATTSSLEALKAYSSAWKVLSSEGDVAALPIFKRATELDPQFALAYANLARSYSALGDTTRSAEATGQAYRLRERTSERERFFIATSYDIDVTGNLERAQQTCELWAQTYPRDLPPHAFLGSFVYPTFGKYEKGLAEARRIVELDPGFAIGYLQVAFNNGFLGRFEEAENVLRQAAARKIEIPEFFLLRYSFAFLKGDPAGMERQAALGREKSGVEDGMADQESLALAYSGHLRHARQMSRRAEGLAQQASKRATAALYESASGVREALFGNVLEARRDARAALALSRGRDEEYGAALAFAISGDSSQSEKLANDLEKRFPEDTAVRSSYLPTLRALTAVNHREPAKAIELLQAASPYELGLPPSSVLAFYGALYPIYVRGEAYLAAHRGTEAAAEFQKILDHRSIVISDPIGALARLQLGRSLAIAGERAKSKAAYADFLALWKDADADLPVFKQASAEFAKL